MNGNNQNIIIQMQDVVKTYSTGDVPFVALDNVNIDIRQGEFLGDYGQVGRGKIHTAQYDLRGQRVDLWKHSFSLGGRMNRHLHPSRSIP